MAIGDADILTQLPLLQWGSLVATAYSDLEINGQNVLAPRAVPYVSGEVHDDMGRKSFKLKTKLLFYNNLSIKPPTGERAFPEYFNRWVPTIIIGAVDTLKHPILGDVRARVEEYKIDVKATIRSGSAIEITWVDTIENPADLNLLGYTNTQLPTVVLAAAVDSAVAPFGVSFASARTPVAVGLQYGIDISITQISVSSIFSVIFPRISLGGFEALSLLAAFMLDLATMDDELRLLDRNDTYFASDSIVTFWNSLDNQRQQFATSARATKIVVTDRHTYLDRIARDTGNQLVDLIGLNLALLYKPGIDKGTPVTVYVV